MADAIATIGLSTEEYTAGERKVAESNSRIARDAAATEAKINAARQANANALDGTLLRGERRVATSSAFLASQLANIQTPAQGVALALEGAARIFQIGFVPTVGIFAAYAAFQKVEEQIKATKKADEDLLKAFALPLPAASHLSPEGIGALITSRTSALEEKAKDSAGFFKRASDALAEFAAETVPGVHAGVGAQRVKDLTEIFQKESNIAGLLSARAAAEEKVTAISKTRLTSSTQEADLADIQLKKENQIAAIEQQRVDLNAKIAASEVLPKEDKPILTSANDAAADRLKQNAQEVADLATKAAKDKANITLLTVESETRAADFRGSSEQKTLNTLQEELGVAKQIADLARKSGQKEAIASADLGVAQKQAALDEFKKETLFKETQELEASRALTEEMDLRAHGEERAAKLAETRAKFEREITADMHAGTLELAQQAKERGLQSIAGQAGALLSRTAPQIAQEQARGQLEAHIQDVGDRAIADARDRIARGARLDLNDPMRKLIADQDALIKAATKTDKTPAKSNLEALAGADFSSLIEIGKSDFSGIETLSGSDFSGIETLASSDFSSLDALSQMDFSGLAPLDGLTITIA